MNLFNKNKSTVTINGKTIRVQGNNITMIGDKVYVDGKEITSTENQTVNIIVEGNANKVECDGYVEVRGDVNGNIRCGGSITCGNVGGSVVCGGSARCGDIKGDVNAGGSVRYRKL